MIGDQPAAEEVAPEVSETVPDIESVAAVSDAGKDSPVIEGEANETEPPLDVERLARGRMASSPKRRNGKDGKRRRNGFFRIAQGFPALVVAVLLIAAFVGLREPIVRLVPDLASAYKLFNLDVNLRGLAFNRVQTFRETADGKPVLVVEGYIKNLQDKPNTVPAIRFAIRGADAQEIYAWLVEPKDRRIRAGGDIRFRTRVNAPPETAFDLQLRFVNRRHRTAG